MILLSLVLVLASAGLLIAGLSTGDHHLVWGSMVASVLAAGALAVAVFRRRPAAAPTDVGTAAPVAPKADRQSADVPARVHSDGAEPHRVGDVDPVPPQNPSLPEHPAPPADEPGIEDASSTDVLRILDLIDEVLVVDERPRYHLADCRHLLGRSAQPLPISEARSAGFTPCALCRPDTVLADRARGGSA